jgi:hypothetical protein
VADRVAFPEGHDHKKRDEWRNMANDCTSPSQGDVQHALKRGALSAAAHNVYIGGSMSRVSP